MVAAHTFLRSFLLRFQECEKACQLTCFFAFWESDAGDLRIHSPVLPPPPKTPHALSVSSILPHCSHLPDVSKLFSPPAAAAALPKPRPPDRNDTSGLDNVSSPWDSFRGERKRERSESRLRCFLCRRKRRPPDDDFAGIRNTQSDEVKRSVFATERIPRRT